jgi:hypothetical protein
LASPHFTDASCMRRPVFPCYYRQCRRSGERSRFGAAFKSWLMNTIGFVLAKEPISVYLPGPRGCPGFALALRANCNPGYSPACA